MFVTIVGLNNYLGIESFKIDQELILTKDLDNPYDDEAIKVLTLNDVLCGYIANSVCTVSRGTHSAGYIYNLIKDKQKCKICFIVDDKIIAKLD